MRKVIIIGLLFCLGVKAEERRGRKAWIISAVIMAAATMADAYTSTGRYESHPFLRGNDGRFSVRRGIALKAGFTGGLIALEAFTVRGQGDRYRAATTANLVSAGLFTGVAIHNARSGKQ